MLWPVILLKQIYVEVIWMRAVYIFNTIRYIFCSTMTNVHSGDCLFSLLCFSISQNCDKECESSIENHLNGNNIKDISREHKKLATELNLFQKEVWWNNSLVHYFFQVVMHTVWKSNFIWKNVSLSFLSQAPIWKQKDTDASTRIVVTDGLWIKAPTPPTITPGFYDRVG